MSLNISASDNEMIKNLRPCAVIIEQPTKYVRFRYECEGRFASCIPGVNSKNGHKTFPRIRIVGCEGSGFVVVSCVTKDKYNGKYRVHPHKIVSKNSSVKDSGVFNFQFSTKNSSEVTFENLGIQNTKKKDIFAALTAREKNKTDPFKAGFEHKNSPQDIDLNSLRLCFEVFFKNEEGVPKLRLAPVVSDPIFSNLSDCLMICSMNRCSASAAGGTEVVLFCEKISKKDIEVWLFETINNVTVWEAKAEFSTDDVHKQVVISCKTPAYHNQSIDKPIAVYIQLRRRSNDERSDPLNFEIYPEKNRDFKLAKRRKTAALIDSLKDRLQSQTSPASVSPLLEASTSMHASNCPRELSPAVAPSWQDVLWSNCPVGSSSVSPPIAPYWPEASTSIMPASNGPSPTTEMHYSHGTSPATGSVYHEAASPMPAKYCPMDPTLQSPLEIQNGNFDIVCTIPMSEHQNVEEQNWDGQLLHEFCQLSSGNQTLQIYNNNNNNNNNVVVDRQFYDKMYQLPAGAYQLDQGYCQLPGGFNQQVPVNQDIGFIIDPNYQFNILENGPVLNGMSSMDNNLSGFGEFVSRQLGICSNVPKITQNAV